MRLLGDIIIGVPIGIVYNVFFHKVGEIVNNNMEYKKRIQRNLILSFIGGIVGIILAFTFFGKHPKYKNRAVQIGLYFGSSILLAHTLFYNWTTLGNDTKLFMTCTLFVMLLWYAYYGRDNDKIRPEDLDEESDDIDEILEHL
jgi:hypothetical protein